MVNLHFVGVDGCSSGWFAIALSDENEFDFALYPDVSALWNKFQDSSVILIDIPIGLREKGSKERLCDKEARHLLGKRGSSVFPAPCRQATYESSYKQASAVNEKYTTKRLTIQCFSLIPKIREVDFILSKHLEAQQKIKEIHPELCFYMLSGKPMEYSKKKPLGYKERIEVLQNIDANTKSIVSQSLLTFKGKGVAKDDILDALVAALTAKLGHKHGLKSVPSIPEIDSNGLPMRMMYTSFEGKL